MKHIVSLLLLILFYNFIDFIHPEKSALHGTGYHCEGQKLIPTNVAIAVWLFLEVIYWIFEIFIIN